MGISENIHEIKKKLGENVKLCAVSKTKPNEDILEAYNAGHRIFGENKVQDLVAKYESLPKDIDWHFIGHLQTNKVKYIAPFISLIHAVDSMKLLSTINKEGKKNNRVIPILFQIKIATEDTKFGMGELVLKDILTSNEFTGLQHIEVRGLMGMATNTPNIEQVLTEFHYLQTVFQKTKSDYFKNNSKFCELSMGMSHDYELAIEEGSTLVRIGSSIFGERNYNK